MKSIATFIRAIALLSVTLGVVGCGPHVLTQAELAERAKKTQDMVEFQECCSKLQDQKLLGEFALAGDSWGKRRTALDYITSESILTQIATTSTNFDIVEYAKQRLAALKSGRSPNEIPKVQWHTVEDILRANRGENKAGK